MNQGRCVGYLEGLISLLDNPLEDIDLGEVRGEVEEGLKDPHLSRLHLFLGSVLNDVSKSPFLDCDRKALLKRVFGMETIIMTE